MNENPLKSEDFGIEKDEAFRLRNEEQKAAVNTVESIWEEFREAGYDTAEIEQIFNKLLAGELSPGEAVIKAYDLRTFMDYDVSKSKAS